MTLPDSETIGCDAASDKSDDAKAHVRQSDATIGANPDSVTVGAAVALELPMVMKGVL